MLERATACIKPGAFRECVRHARDVRRSKRMLHSTFWNHGAGNLDLTPWVLTTSDPPSDLPLRHDSIRRPREKSARHQQALGDSCPLPTPFLDFLYPPQALAWLQHRQGVQLRAIDRRNAKRLPSGFVAVSRRYATDSYRPFGEDTVDTADIADPQPKARQRIGASRNRKTRKRRDIAQSDDMLEKAVYFGEDDEGSIRPGGADHGHQVAGHLRDTLRSSPDAWGLSQVAEEFLEGDAARSEGLITGGPEKDIPGTTAEEPFAAFGDSPGEIAEIAVDRMRLLRSIIMSPQRHNSLQTAAAKETLIRRAWAIYDSLDGDVKSDPRLKKEMLQWLATQGTDFATARCQQLFRSIIKSSRTAELYQAMLSLYLRRSQLDLARELHREALDVLENGYLISRVLFTHAVNHELWQLAVDTAIQHETIYTEGNKISQVRVFWLHVSELPQLFVKATQLAKHFGLVEGLRAADMSTREFCKRFFKEAISQEFLRSEDDRKLSFTQAHAEENVPRSSIRAMFQHIIDMDPNAANYLAQVMIRFLKESSEREYAYYHNVFSYIYLHYCELPGVVPSQELLAAFLRCLGTYSGRRRVVHATENSVDVSRIVDDWKKHHGRLSSELVTLLLTHYARFGKVKQYEHMLEYQRQFYPEYRAQKPSFWTRIYIHACRADLDSAQQAFAEIQRTMADHGERPDLQCWDVLLHAHARVDDLEGAITNFNNIISHAKLRPDSYSFSPLLHMLARRGDVEGVEDLLRQYDSITGAPRNTNMMRSLMVASFNNGENARAAEQVLQDTIAKRSQGEVVGPLTPCFNALVAFHAIRRNINATMRIYRQMRQEKVRLNGETFGPLILVLVNVRQPGAALTILQKVMPEHQVRPTAYQYSLVMAGLFKQRLFQDAVDLFKKMEGRNVQPSPTMINYYLHAKARLEGAQLREASNTKEPSKDEIPLSATLQELQEMLDRYDMGELTAANNVSATHELDNNNPYATIFSALIYAHGQQNCLKAAQALFEQLKEKSQLEHGNATVSIRVIAALMSAQYNAGEHAQVEEYWKLARQQADDISRSVQIPQFSAQLEEHQADADPLRLKPFEDDEEDADDGELSQTHAMPQQPEVAKQTLLTDTHSLQPRPSPARRDILNVPLRWYLRALTAQSRVYDAITTVSGLLTQGYTLTKRTWNLFVRSLLDTRPPLALLAFVLTERFMIHNFPGWTRSTDRPPRPINKRENLEYMSARYVPKSKIMPEYITLVRLGAAMLDLRRYEATGRQQNYEELPPELRKFVGTLGDVRKRAAKTVYAIQSMPAVPDKVQAKYLGDQGQG